MTVRALVVVALAAHALSALSGCAHQTTVQSDPPGATVYVDDEKRGQTPLVVESRTGPVDMTRVEVVDETTGEAVRFELIHNSLRSELVVAGIAAGVATFVAAGLFVVPYVFGVLALEAFVIFGAIGGTGTPNELVSLGTAVSAAVAILSYAALFALAASAPWVALGTIGELSHTAPDEVFVDFDENDVTSSPMDALRLLDGTAHGRTPMRALAAPGIAPVVAPAPGVPAALEAPPPTTSLPAEEAAPPPNGEPPVDADARGDDEAGATAPDIAPDLVDELP